MAPDYFTRFRNEESAYKFVERNLWPNGPVCPHCRNLDRVAPLRGESTRFGTYKCYSCRKPFSVKKGTIFESSNVPMHKWLQAMFLCAHGRHDLKPNELSRILSVSFRTAAFILHRLRSAAASSGLLHAFGTFFVWY
jgi:transposase-like protein